MAANNVKTKDGLDKNNKYDRQLRLWGDHGQTALESARVCLINATATGTEILKNLILPGIGSFTIVDGHKVQGENVGNNFFLTKDSIGESRAKCATELLSELNPDVSGDFLEEHPDKLLETNKEFFRQFTIVIASDLCERVLLLLGSYLWECNIPLLVCRSYGFIGYMRLVIREHTVIESHPDNAHEDLRLDHPFEALQKFCDALDLDAMNKKDHSHTPWLVVLYKYLQIWKEQHNGELPKNYKEKNLLKNMIREGVRQSEEGGLEDEENFDEAIRAVNTALHTTQVPSEVQKLFTDPACDNVNAESSNFWILVRALRDFVHNEGNESLPLRGTIPDMTADSDRYIQLQNVYRQQADHDTAQVHQRLQDLLQEIGRDEPVQPTAALQSHSPAFRPGSIICDQEIKTFCKNSAFLRLVRCRSLEMEYSNTSEKLKEIGSHLENEDPDDVVFYVLLRAVDKFYETHNTYPGWYNNSVESDVVGLKACLHKLLNNWGIAGNIKDDYIHEMCRFGASELHSVASFMGGTAAQEVIKIITGQFVPFNNTFIYNAMKQTSTTFEV